MAKKRKQLYRAKRYRQDKAIEKLRHNPNYKPVSFWEYLDARNQMEQHWNELANMVLRGQCKKLANELNYSGESVNNTNQFETIEYQPKFIGEIKI